MDLFPPKLATRALKCISYRNLGFPFQMPYKITFSVTYSCNSRCKLCGIWKIYKEKPGLRKEELTLEEIELIFRDMGNSLLWLSLTGGEPFMRDDLVDIVNSATKNCRNLSLISINTNGLSSDKVLADMEEILSMNPSRRFFSVISLDGTEKVHERLRGIKGSYEKTTDTIYSLKKLSERYKNLNVYAETVISEYNVDELGDFLESDICRDCEIAFAFAQNSDYYNNEENVKVPVSYVRGMDRILKKSGIRGYEGIASKIFYRLAKRQLNDLSRQVIPCYSSFASVFIGPHGNVKPCIMMNPVENLRDYEFDLGELLRGDSFKGVQREIKSSNCPGCWTPCEALQTIIQNFPVACIKSFV